MKLQDHPPLHLTYCLNIHPGEGWAENFHAIRTKTLVVRDRVGAGKPFGLGLRLSRRAAAELAQPDELKRFKDFLRENGLYVFTINGFPFGAFHGESIKDRVYGPDWRTSERLRYTVQLAEILAELLPEGLEGSISTVPGSYKEWIKGPADVAAMVENLAACAAALDGIARRTGRMVRLALEPEPDCYLERTEEVVEFLGRMLIEEGTRQVSEQVLREHIGVCLDTCHQAVQFEEVEECLRVLEDAGVRIAKVQLSSALRTGFTAEAQAELAAFCDVEYLHQARMRTREGTIRSFRDLPELLAAEEKGDIEEVRVHFHVPLFFEGQGELRSTASMLSAEFFEMLRAGVTSHVEIETYTFGVLPETMRRLDVTTNIVREYEWVLDRLRPGKS